MEKKPVPSTFRYSQPIMSKSLDTKRVKRKRRTFIGEIPLDYSFFVFDPVFVPSLQACLPYG